MSLSIIIIIYTCACVGLNVVEVAHDNWKNYVVNDLKLINSYDTWHGKVIENILSAT